MALPSMEQYNEAVQNPVYAFHDPELQKGKVKTTGLGVPLAACGGFALTYTLTCGSNKYAVRCFHKEVKDREVRYSAISARLAQLRSSYFVAFEYQKNGIRIRNQDYPVVKMAWAGGVTIGQFMEANYRNRDYMLNLKNSLLSLSSYLEKVHIAHGDIQPGNLMVADDGRTVQLIDYDGIYLPELASLNSAETGHRNFSHPERESLNPWNERSDRFSFILLDIVLDAVMASPDVWRKTQSDGDKFLFSANDFLSPDTSPTFSLLSSLPGLKEPLAKFSSICNGAYDDTPSIGDFLDAAIEIESPPQESGITYGYISTYPVLDAKDYDACLAHVGDVVELVGKVENVRSGTTRYGSPYYFINFSDWRGRAVKISVWSDYLAKAENTDFEMLAGEYISVIGLMQPPYESRRYGYTHLSISLDGTINTITHKEFKYRLNYEKNPIPKRSPARRKKAEKKQSNRTIFEDIKKGRTGDCGTARFTTSSPASSGAGKISSAQAATGSVKRSNRDILNDIKGASSGQPSGRIVNCPHCQGQNYIRVNVKTNVRCPLCQREYFFDPASKNSGSPVSASGNARLVLCPCCGRTNFVDANVKSRLSCPFCQQIYNYDPATGAVLPESHQKSGFSAGSLNQATNSQTAKSEKDSGWIKSIFKRISELIGLGVMIFIKSGF